MEFLEAYPVLRDLLIVCAMLASSTILYYLTKRYVMRCVLFVFRQTPYNWDESLYEQGVFNDLPLLVPAFVLSQGLTFVPSIAVIGQRLITVWVIFILVKFVDKLLSGALNIYNSYDISAGADEDLCPGSETVYLHCSSNHGRDRADRGITLAYLSGLERSQLY